MAIIRTLNNLERQFPDGAFCPIESHKNPIVIHTTHVGLCLYKTDTTNQGSIMTVWNDELKCPERIDCADEQGFVSSPDATPTVKAHYQAWQVRKDHAATINHKWYARRQDRLLAQQMALKTYHAVRRLRGALTGEQFQHATALLKVKNFKSTQRSTTAGMLRAWANNPKPKFPTPLPPSQLKTL